MKWLLVIPVLFANAAIGQAQILIPSAAPMNWSVGDPNSTAFHWDNFTTGGTYPGPFTPDLASVHPGLPNATMVETTGQGFLTGGGNIYSPTSAITIATTIPNFNLGAGWSTRVVIQTRTLGSELDYANLNLSWTDAGGNHSLNTTDAFLSQHNEYTPLGGFGGFAVTHIWGFDVAANPGQFSLNFAGATSSVSFDQLRIDTLASHAPEPSSFLLLGGAVLVAWRRRMKS